MMTEKQFYIFEDNIRGNFGEVDKPLNNTEIVDKLNEQQATIEEQNKEIEESSAFIIEQRKENKKLNEENERLRNQLERKTILLKIRTKHIDDREKSFYELLNYLGSFCYKSNIDGNYAKQDIINILNNWEIREYD